MGDMTAARANPSRLKPVPLGAAVGRVRRAALRAVATLLVLVGIGGTAHAQPERSDTPLSTAEIARRVTPTVVTIATPTGNGSGVIVDPSGVVVTNLHVVEGEALVEVELPNGDIYDDVAVVDVDERRDLILLKIKAFNLDAADFGNSDDVQVGDDVVLVGSPEGLDSTVSAGVISALRDSGDGYRLIQTSAPASPGSSGGGMFSTFGELVGIVTSQTREGQNLNFAVPVNYVRGLLPAGAPMTLTELTDVEWSTRTDSTSGSDTRDQASTRRLSAIVEDLRAATGIEDLLEFSDADDGLWIATYSDGSHLDEVVVGIRLITDEFDEDIVWILSALPESEVELTPRQLRELLGLSFDLNFAKVALDDDGDVHTMVEAELRTLDAEGLLRAVFAVADAADDVARRLGL